MRVSLQTQSRKCPFLVKSASVVFTDVGMASRFSDTLINPEFAKKLPSNALIVVSWIVGIVLAEGYGFQENVGMWDVGWDVGVFEIVRQRGVELLQRNALSNELFDINIPAIWTFSFIKLPFFAIYDSVVQEKIFCEMMHFIFLYKLSHRDGC